MKYLRMFLITVALALASTHTTAQQVGAIKDLDEGFVARSITFTSGREIIQIVFPAKYRVFEEDVLVFNEGAEHALKNYFGCAKFPKCQPKLDFTDGVTALVGTDVYHLTLLHFSPSDPDSKVVGISAVKIPKVII